MAARIALEVARAGPLPGVLDTGDVVVLELLVSSLKVVVGVVTVVLFVVIWVVEVSDMNENCCRWLDKLQVSLMFGARTRTFGRVPSPAVSCL